uniref:Uncharacterized protein LOC113784760 n=1 Tax=Cicer arietinum TaxID=3827 RepID=A0A3Q7XSJ3_CICAR|nr:uncharacterized protein LOC113784760 [Cicer arietinum]
MRSGPSTRSWNQTHVDSRFQFKDLVPCILVNFDKQQIVVWRGKDYKHLKGGRTRGRVYGTGDLSINVRQGCVSLTQHSQNPSNSIIGMSLEAERVARIRAEQIAQDVVAQAQVAT